MAHDTLELLTALSWLPSNSTQADPHRTLHIIGLSMGGMICQELALLIPHHIASLSLVSTAARLTRDETIGWLEHVRQRVGLFVPKSMDKSVEVAKKNMFSDKFLSAPDYDADGPNADCAFAGSTPCEDVKNLQEVQWVGFANNGDRFAAQEVFKRLAGDFTRKGLLLQGIAAGWHYKSPAQLEEIAEKVGRGRIGVWHGTVDKMIPFGDGRELARGLGLRELKEGRKLKEMGDQEGAFRKKPDVGHVIMMEERGNFGREIAELVGKGEWLAGR
ncbi:MAG: hypothetical protein Q9227_001075 [Pyrenula ochraceoflavens]